MDFLGMGAGEILIVLILVLVLFGPGKIPEAARTVGRYARTLKKMSSELTDAVSQELNTEEQTGKNDSSKAVEQGHATFAIAGPLNAAETKTDLPGVGASRGGQWPSDTEVGKSAP